MAAEKKMEPEQRSRQTKNRNEARREFRRDNPEHRNKRLKKWPIEKNIKD